MVQINGSFFRFHWASGDPSRKSGDTLWIRFIQGPIWPLLLVFAILPVGLFWWRRRWPCEQRRAAVRIALIGYSLPMAIAAILLILAIIAGDFNADPNELEIRRIVDTGKFAAKLNGPFTISSYDQHRTIDHIFAPRDWQLLEHRVIQTDLSDHLPVLSTFRIPLVADRD